MQKHPRQVRLRQLVPPAFVAAVAGSALVAPFSTIGRVALVGSLGSYLVVNLAASVAAGRSRPRLTAVLSVDLRDPARRIRLRISRRPRALSNDVALVATVALPLTAGGCRCLLQMSVAVPLPNTVPTVRMRILISRLVDCRSRYSMSRRSFAGRTSSRYRLSASGPDSSLASSWNDSCASPVIPGLAVNTRRWAGSVHVDERRILGSRPDQRHLPPDDVDQLRQLVEPVTPEDPSDAGHPRIAEPR